MKLKSTCGSPCYLSYAVRLGSVVLVVAAVMFDFKMCITASRTEHEQIFSRQVMQKPNYLPSYGEILSLIQLVKNKSRQSIFFPKQTFANHLDQDGFVHPECTRIPKEAQRGTRMKDRLQVSSSVLVYKWCQLVLRETGR